MKQSHHCSWLPPTLLILGLLLLVLSESGYLAPMGNALHYALDPLRRAFLHITETTGDLFPAVREVSELRAEVEDLQAQVDALTIERVRLQEYKIQAQQLDALWNSVRKYPGWAFVGADVINWGATGDTFSHWDVMDVESSRHPRYIIINVGTRQGVGVGMLVLTSEANLVGQVAQVSSNTAKVQLLTSPDSAIAALLETSQATGLVVGWSDDTLRMEYIPQEENVNIGERVLSLGLGNSMPKGLVIGQVTKVHQRDYELFQSATVQPMADFSRLEIVLVITASE
jgi:rod shape-determining protein MreC